MTWRASPLLLLLLLSTPFAAQAKSARTRDSGSGHSQHSSIQQRILKHFKKAHPYTLRHSARVGVFAKWTARELQLSPEAIRQVSLGGALHDVGKLLVAESLLNKPGRLTESEFTLIKRHAAEGARMLRKLLPQTDADFRAAVGIAAFHHERWDGKGYPAGLSGEKIPLLARVVSVADAFDAMTSQRSYNNPMTVGEAVAELKRGAGTQFDAAVVAAFARTIGRRPKIGANSRRVHGSLRTEAR